MPQEALNLISYRGVLVSTLLHATVYVFAECTSTDCKLNGSTKKNAFTQQHETRQKIKMFS
jgi:hypothetical protein